MPSRTRTLTRRRPPKADDQTETRRPNAMNRRNYSRIVTLAAFLAGSFICPQAKAYLVPLSPDGNGHYNIAAVQTCVKLNNPRLAAGTGAQTVFACVYWDPTTPPLPTCLNTNTCTP